MIGDAGPELPTPRRLGPITTALTERDAIAFVHVGPRSEPGVRYCLGAQAPAGPETTGPYAVAITTDGRVVVEQRTEHPAERLATRLRDQYGTGQVLTPATIPHDAALYLERAGFELASTDALDTARSAKTASERERIVEAQTAAGAGVRRAATMLSNATTGDDRLHWRGETLTTERLRRAVDAAVVSAGAFPAGATSVETTETVAMGTDASEQIPIRPGKPVVVDVGPQGQAGYRSRLVRTLVAESEGGWERRAHVAVESALRSAQVMLEADEATVRDVETELVAEVRSFGFDEAASASVVGVGLEPRERPLAAGHRIGSGAVVALQAAVEADDGRRIELGDLLIRHEGADWLGRLSRSLEPSDICSS